MTPYLNRESAVLRVVSVTRDVTEQVADPGGPGAQPGEPAAHLRRTSDGMFAYEVDDPQGRLLFVNDRFLEMWEYAARRRRRR